MAGRARRGGQGGGKGLPVHQEGVQHDIDQEAGQHVVGVEGQQGGASNGRDGGGWVLPGLQLLKPS